jgi:tetratricopeptide (TPR) repeat protein
LWDSDLTGRRDCASSAAGRNGLKSQEGRGHWQEWAATQRTALAAATRLGDTAAQALSGRLLANACTELGDHDQALGHGLLGDYQQARVFCRQALTLCAEAGDRWVEGDAWDSLGYAEHHLGNLAEAAACYRRAVDLHRESGYRRSEAEALTHLGDTRHAAGELAQARETWQQALAILDDMQHPDAGQVRARLTSTTAF